MRFSPKILQATAIFPPVLAILVGLSLFLRVRHEDEISARLGLAETISSESLELSTLTHEYLQHRDEQTRQQWHFRYDAMRRQGVARLAARSLLKERTNADSMLACYDSIGQLFDRLSGEQGSGVISSGVERELLGKLQTVTSNALQLLQSSHMDAVASEQVTDAIIIILSALVAVMMAIGVYMAFRQEMAQREKADEALRESDIRLSDAFLKLKRASDQVVQTEHLHTLEHVSRSIVHDWKNAVTPVLASVQYLPELLGADQQNENVKGMLSVIEGSIKKADAEVGRLGDLLKSGAASGKMPVDINKVVAAALHATVDRWKNQPNWQRIEVRTELPEIQPVYGNAEELIEALKNLIINAADAMPKGGAITVRTQTAGQWVGLEISDTGVGMAEDVRRKCMEPFFSTKGPGEAGMGLTITQGIVKRHNGTIDVESVPGRGTTVAICLPTNVSQPAPVQKHPDHKTRKLKILVVDDESWSRVALIHTLMTEGHTVETANNGQEGLEKFRRNGFDVVVTDHAMPGMTGQELAAAVKRIDPSKRVIMVTGYCDTIEEKERKKSGVDGIIGKPIRASELIDTLETVMQSKS
jgi:signal transduction histidine kinase/ActR/RegA family two-component response regulator